MLDIGIDTSRTAEAKTGLGSYGASLLAGLARVDRTNRYTLHPFLHQCFVDRYDRAFRPRQSNFRTSRGWLPRPFVVKAWHEGWIDKDWLVGGPHDVFLAPFHAVPRRHMGRLVSVFHDVAFLAHPGFSTEENVRFCTEQLEQARLRADLVLTVSEFSRSEILRHVAIEPGRVVAVHEAADPRYRPVTGAVLPPRLADAIGPGPFVLFVGSVEPRKNLITLVHAWARLVASGDAPGKLVIAGGGGWKNSDVFHAIERLGITDRVHCTGFVTDEELVALYNTATCFTYPTVYEGFGLPVIEAMACGTPVVTTRVSSIPEVGGDAVVYVDDPHDVMALAAAIGRVLADPALRAELRTRGIAQAARFSWDETARRTLALLTEVATSPRYARHELVVGTDERGIDVGWQPAENAEGRPFRWVGRSATLWLTPRGDTPFVVDLGTPLESGQELTVLADGKPLGAPARLHQGWQQVRFEARGLPQRQHRVELRTNVGLDSRHKGADPRDLALMVRSAGFRATD
ncbi:MAG: hypothetical protein RL148_1454 [Planctomycetota bacterium]|jgi:glycosyltransferase involved in cell wall biosynthesis